MSSATRACRSSRAPTVYGDNVDGELWGATLSGTTLATATASGDHDLGLSVPSLSGMGEDACGRVYVTLLGGDVKRLVNDSGGYTCTAALATPQAPGTPPAQQPVPTPSGLRSDKTPPKLSVSFASHQHGAELGRLILHLGCNEHCTLLAHATLHIGSHSHALAAVRVVIAAGSHVTLKMKLSGALRSLVRAALRRHRHPRVAVHLRVADAAGNVRLRAFNVALSG